MLRLNKDMGCIGFYSKPKAYILLSEKLEEMTILNTGKHATYESGEKPQ